LPFQLSAWGHNDEKFHSARFKKLLKAAFSLSVWGKGFSKITILKWSELTLGRRL
jgi:hypothetical protein